MDNLETLLVEHKRLCGIRETLRRRKTSCGIKKNEEKDHAKFISLNVELTALDNLLVIVNEKIDDITQKAVMCKQLFIAKELGI